MDNESMLMLLIHGLREAMEVRIFQAMFDETRGYPQWMVDTQYADSNPWTIEPSIVGIINYSNRVLMDQ